MSKHWNPAESNLPTLLQDLGVSDLSDSTKATVSRLADETGRQRSTPIVQPIVHSATYRVDSVQGYLDILKEGGGHIYSRLGNSTCEATECAINSLEGGSGTLVFSCGMAAVSTALLSYLKAGDHVVACHPLYSGTYDLLVNYLVNFNISHTFVDYSIDQYRAAIQPNTKVLYGETPCNPGITILDMEEFGKLGRSREGLVTMVDSTFASPYLLKPIKYDIDMVIHSGTKYLGGHSDLVAGVITTRTIQQWKTLNVARAIYGGTLSPFDASLLLRGVRTLPVRMDRHCANAQRIAEFLESHPKIERVFYPGLKSHSGHETAKKQMKAFGGMITFEVKGGLQPAKMLVENLHIIQLAVSLGGTESLIEHPASMTHGPMLMSDEDRRAGHITDGLIRFSVGIEDADDLILDLQRALEKVS